MLSNKKNATKNFVWISAFFGSLSTKKQQEKRRNWKNPNCLMKFSEIWYVDASQQNKIATKKLFLDFGLFWPFFNQKNSQN